MSILETERLNGHNVPERVNGADEDVDVVNRDHSRLPVKNLDAYKNWCQRVKADWDPANQ